MTHDPMDTNIGARLRDARTRWGWSQDTLAARAGVGPATVSRLELGQYDPRLSTIRKLADAMQVYPEWLLGADLPMVPLAAMTLEEQFKVHAGPGTDGLPGFVIVSPGGPWYRDNAGEWRVAATDSQGQGE